MKYRFFTNSNKAWEMMFQDIQNAKKSIYLEMYIFENDMHVFDFFKILKEKAKQGIQIKIILDAFGSINLTNEEILDLKNNGVEVLFLSFLRYRMHRKVLIIDESIAFIGGVNLHQTAKMWNDLMVKIKGKLVLHIIKSFAKSYVFAGGKDIEFISKSKKIVFQKMNAWIVEHSPMKRKFTLKKIYESHILGAKNNIVLVTPYFIPKRWLGALLHQAILSGVQVDILIPKTTDHYILDRVNYFYMNRFSKMGINFYLENEMNHAKVMIIDDMEAMIGSQNLDFLSFDFNSEIGVFFQDKEVVSNLLEIVQKWKNNSVVFNNKTYVVKWFDYFISPFMNFFSKFL